MEARTASGFQSPVKILLPRTELSSPLRYSLFGALIKANTTSIGNTTLFGSRCKRNFWSSTQNRYPITPLSAALVGRVALPRRTEKLTGRDRVGGKRLWRTTSPWCFDKGYPAELALCAMGEVRPAEVCLAEVWKNIEMLLPATIPCLGPF